MTRLAIAFVLATLLVLDDAAQTSIPYPAAEWRASTPEEQGIDSARLAALIEQVCATQPNIHSLSIVRNGFLILDASFYPYRPGTPHDLASVTKSITSTLVGSAIYKRYLSGVHQTLGDLFSARLGSAPDALKQIQLKHLLTMTSGWDCGLTAGEPELFRMFATRGWLRFTLELPVKNPPGAHFAYCSSGVHALSVALREATGRTALQYAKDELFGPLDIHEAIWPVDPQGNNFGWGDLRLRPLDLGKIGYLFLQRGVWNGKRILSPDWIDNATKAQVPLPERGGAYGYLWWLYPGAYVAMGRGGQMLAVVPEKNLIVVVTGGGVSTRDILLSVDKAVVANTLLPANTAAFGNLQAKLEKARQAPLSGAMPEIPEGTGGISGREYRLEENLIGWKSFVLSVPAKREAVLEMSLAGLMGQGRFVLPVGLDGRYRLTPGRHGLQAALKGQWQSRETFVLDFNEIGNINRWEISFTFVDNSVTVVLKEKTGLPTFTIKGKAGA
jgi:CubicO group peptidase (beta-lactamase class C family)